MSVEGLEEAPEAWQDFILDVEQRLADKIGRPERHPPRSRRWFIEAYRENEAGIELVLAARTGIGEPAYLRAVIIGTGIESGWPTLPNQPKLLTPIMAMSNSRCLSRLSSARRMASSWCAGFTRLYGCTSLRIFRNRTGTPGLMWAVGFGHSPGVAL